MSGTFGPQWNSGKAWRACKRDDCSDSERASEARTVSTSNANVAPVRAYKAMLRPCYYSGLNLNDAARCSSFFFLSSIWKRKQLRANCGAHRRRNDGESTNPTNPAARRRRTQLWVAYGFQAPLASQLCRARLHAVIELVASGKSSTQNTNVGKKITTKQIKSLPVPEPPFWSCGRRHRCTQFQFMDSNEQANSMRSWLHWEISRRDIHSARSPFYFVAFNWVWMRACVSVVLCARTTCYCHSGCVRARARSGVCLQKLRSLQGNGKRRMWSQELEESAAVLVCVLLSLSLRCSHLTLHVEKLIMSWSRICVQRVRNETRRGDATWALSLASELCSSGMSEGERERAWVSVSVSGIGMDCMNALQLLTPF